MNEERTPAVRGTAARQTTPAQITEAVIASFAGCAQPRLRAMMTRLIGHLHAFVREAEVTEAEWHEAIRILTRTGGVADANRQELILWSDMLGISMLVDALSHPASAGVTEPTALGPFYVSRSPLRGYGDSIAEKASGDIAEKASGDPAWVHGRVLGTGGRPLADAELGVRQNGENRLYAVQDPEAPEAHLRGRCHTPRGRQLRIYRGTAASLPDRAGSHRRLRRHCVSPAAHPSPLRQSR